MLLSKLVEADSYTDSDVTVLLSPACNHVIVSYMKCAPSLCVVSLKQRLPQRSHLHTVLEGRGPASRAVLGHRHSDRLLLVSAVAVRHSSSQVRGAACLHVALLQ